MRGCKEIQRRVWEKLMTVSQINYSFMCINANTTASYYVKFIRYNINL